LKDYLTNEEEGVTMITLKEAYETFAQFTEARAARKPFASNLALKEIGKSCLRQLNREAPLVWTRCTFPQEIIATFDALPVSTELVSTVIGFTKMGPDFLLTTESLGFSTDSCTVQRVPLGAILTDDSISPSLMIGVTDFCEDGMRFFEHAIRHYKRDYILLEVPPDYNEESVDYVEVQLKEIIQKLSEVTGQAFDIDKLRELIRSSNQVTNYKKKINELRKEIPAKFSGRRDGDFFPLLEFGISGETAVDLAKQFYEEILQDASVRKDKTERARILWLYTLPPVSKMIETMEEQWGAKVVATEANRIYWDELEEKEPVRSIARKLCQSRTIGPIENRLGHIIELANEFSITGAVHFSHFSCAYSVGAIRVIKDKLGEKGIPFLNLDGDCGVMQNNNVEAMMEDLEGFIERITI
jgi:benzoyl-CoA reductase/2-hydroxyglutaryl-CoA dehydratase subunit BcrC/BadD/HgdB